MNYPNLKSLQPIVSLLVDVAKSNPWVSAALGAGAGIGITLLAVKAKDENDKQLRQEKERLLKMALEEQHAIITALKDEVEATRESAEHLLKLQTTINNLKADIEAEV